MKLKVEKMNDYKSWVKDAQVKLAQAEECLDRWPADAFQKVFKSAEFLLKAVLERAGKFVPRPVPRGDKTHELHRLIDKIEREGCLPPEIIRGARKILPELERINVGGPPSAPSHINTSDYSSEIGYPKAGVPSTERISKKVAKRKIDLLKKLHSLLIPYLG